MKRYKVKVLCGNCTHRTVVEMKCGDLVTETHECPHCGCTVAFTVIAPIEEEKCINRTLGQLRSIAKATPEAMTFAGYVEQGQARDTWKDDWKRAWGGI